MKKFFSLKNDGLSRFLIQVALPLISISISLSGLYFGLSANEFIISIAFGFSGLVGFFVYHQLRNINKGCANPYLAAKLDEIEITVFSNRREIHRKLTLVSTKKRKIKSYLFRLYFTNKDEHADAVCISGNGRLTRTPPVDQNGWHDCQFDFFSPFRNQGDERKVEFRYTMDEKVGKADLHHFISYNNFNKCEEVRFKLVFDIRVKLPKDVYLYLHDADEQNPALSKTRIKLNGINRTYSIVRKPALEQQRRYSIQWVLKP